MIILEEKVYSDGELAVLSGSASLTTRKRKQSKASRFKTIVAILLTRILRRALSKGKAYEGENRHFEAKRGHLSRLLVIFQEITTFL